MELNVEALKEPRGLLRLMQWLFALVAFATCCDFTVTFGFQIFCSDTKFPGKEIKTIASYPYQIDQQEAIQVEKGLCNSTSQPLRYSFPGDYSSDAQFYVFIGVITWLYSSATLALYIFYSNLYLDEQKSYPKYDLIIAAVLAFIWLCAASAWAHAVLGLRGIADVESYIFTDTESPCFKNGDTFNVTGISRCKWSVNTGFSKANSSVLIGFLNVFLWASNIWFLYKETTWYNARNQMPAPGSLGP